MLDIPQNTYELIKFKRNSLGLTQKEFAELLGLNSSGERTIRGWERNEHSPSPSKLRDIQNLSIDVPFKQTDGDYKFKFIDL